MKLTFKQILDIKCILANKSKLQITSELGKSSNFLSREISDKDDLKIIDDYFDNINPDINLFCNKLHVSDALEVNEDAPTFKKQPQFDIKDRIINILEKQIDEKDKQIRMLIENQSKNSYNHK